VTRADSDLETLSARVVALEAALQEANETLDAIRNGEVDAVVVGGPHGQVVYTLENADRPYRVLVEQMREGAVTVASDGTVLYCNGAFADLIANRVEELVGKPIFELVEDEARLRGMLAEAGAAGVSAEIRLRLRGGGFAETHISVVELVVEDASAPMLCLIVTDLRQSQARARELSEANARLAAEIDERRRAEQSLAFALDAADMGSWDLDLKSGLATRSARYDSILGYSEPQRSAGFDIERFVAEDQVAVAEALAQAPASGRIEFERRIRRVSDGAIRWVQVKGRAFGRDGVAERLAGIMVDTTERRQIEEALRQGQKMEAIGQLTGGIAHDFNNLLMIIGGSLESLSRRVRLDDRVQRLLDAARLGVARGAKLNEQLLAFARRQELHEEVVCVTDLLPTFETLLDRAVGEAVRVELQRRDDLWYCRADPHQLETAILNLAINARDAMNEHGTLTLSTHNVSVPAALANANDAEPGDYVVVSVADTGGGMPPEIAARVFEPFFTTKELGKGTGLGLSQVYGFARQSNGFIQLETKPGEGTTVSIYLPRANSAEAKIAGLPASDMLGRAEGSVLLVEDDEDVRAATGAMLEELGYRVIEAETALEAMSVLDGGAHVDLVFTDVIMATGITGLELARKIRAKLPDLPILLTSGYTAQKMAPDAVNGELTLLRKPYTLTQLATALRQLTDAT
jgi:PAS domain S-box-containing protein